MCEDKVPQEVISGIEDLEHYDTCSKEELEQILKSD